MMNYNYNQPPNPMEELKRFFRSGSALSVLILINATVWALVQVIKVVVYLAGGPESGLAEAWVMQNFAIPASLPALIERPWTVITYMFLHVEIWHVLFNMLWLYWFGKIFLEYLNNRKLLTVYLLGGISGGLVYVLAFNFFPRFQAMVPISFAIGASAAVMAIVTTISFYVPQYTVRLLFFGNVRILYMAILLFVFDFFMIPSGNAGGHLAHIGGAIFGFLFAQVIRNSPAAQGNRNSGPSIFRFAGDFFQRMRRKSPAQSSGGRYQRPVSDEDYNFRKVEMQRKTDEILEKISKGGYDSLTKAEKEFLFRSSNKR